MKSGHRQPSQGGVKKHSLGLAVGSIGFIRGRTLAKLRKFLIESGYSRKGMA